MLAIFAAWERRTPHPMLDMRFFRNSRFSAAVFSVGLATFGLFGALFGCGLWQVSTASAATTYTGILAGIIMLGSAPGWSSRPPPSR